MTRTHVDMSEAARILREVKQVDPVKLDQLLRGAGGMDLREIAHLLGEAVHRVELALRPNPPPPLATLRAEIFATCAEHELARAERNARCLANALAKGPPMDEARAGQVLPTVSAPCLALDEATGTIFVSGKEPIRHPRSFALMHLLVGQSRADRAAGLHPDRYECLSIGKLAGEKAGRSRALG